MSFAYYRFERLATNTSPNRKRVIDRGIHSLALRAGIVHATACSAAGYDQAITMKTVHNLLQVHEFVEVQCEKAEDFQRLIRLFF